MYTETLTGKDNVQKKNKLHITRKNIEANLKSHKIKAKQLILTPP